MTVGPSTSTLTSRTMSSATGMGGIGDIALVISKAWFWRLNLGEDDKSEGI